MIIIKIRNFTCLKSTDFELPSNGATLIVGTNGTGKSSRSEALAHVLYNKSLRHPTGKPTGWRAGEAGGIRVEWGDKWVERRMSKGGKQTLKSWLQETNDYPTTTKHQAAIEEHIGTFEDWRRASFLTSKDGGRFVMATDKARKEILERVIGLDKLSHALKQVRSDLKTGRADKQLKSYTATTEQQKADLIQRELDALLPEKPQEVDLDALRKQAGQLSSKKKKLTQELSELSERNTEIALKLRDLASQRESINQKLLEVDKGLCSACGQPLSDPVDKKPLETELELLAEKRALVAKESQELPSSKTLNEELSKAISELESINQTAIAYKKALSDWEGASEKHASREADWKDQQNLAQEAKVADKEAAETLEVLEVCDKVLAPKGVRSKLLEQAVESMNAVLAVYTAQLCGPSATVKVGLEKDAITVDVQGISEVQSYMALSDGQKCRVDLALGLALSSLCSSNNPEGLPSLLILDEAFDGMDAEGVEAALQMVKDLSNTRSVVLISHNQGLISQFSGDVLRCS